MKDVIEDLIKLGVDVSKLTESKLNSLATKLSKHKPISKEDAKKIVVEGIRTAAKAQRKLAIELERRAKNAVNRVNKVKSAPKKKSRKR